MRALRPGGPFPWRTSELLHPVATKKEVKVETEPFEAVGKRL
jgi:hypothetical protein